MRGESWATHLVIGLCIVGAGSWSIWTLEREPRIDEVPVVSLPVAESLAPPGAPPRRVVLTDLVVECERMQSVDGHVYVPGRGDGRHSRVAVEVTPGEDCDTMVARAHRIDMAPQPVAQELFESRGAMPREDLARARPFASEGSQVVGIGIVVVGLLWMLWALQMRREYEMGLAEALARAAAPIKRRPTADAASAQGPYRADSEDAPLLPRPLVLHPRALAEQRRTGIATLVLACSIAALTLGLLGHSSSEQLLEQERWAEGTVARGVSASGEVRSRLGDTYQSARFAYVYYDQQRRPHVGERSFSTLLGDFKTRDFVVRFDPDQPERHAIAWLGEHTGPLWMALSVYSAFGLALAIVVLVVARQALATPRRWKAVLDHPEEVELSLTSRVELMTRGSSMVTVQYTFAVPGSDQPFEYRASDPSRSPFFLDLDCTRALGLRNPKRPGAVMVLCADLSPLDVELGVEQEIRARAKKSAKTAED